MPEALLVAATTPSPPGQTNKDTPTAQKVQAASPQQATTSFSWVFAMFAFACGAATFAFLVFGQGLSPDAPTAAMGAAVIVLLYALRQLFAIVYALGFESTELWVQDLSYAGGVAAETRADYRRILRAIKQLDEDHEVGKLADADHQSLREGLALRAVELKRQLASLEAQEGVASAVHPELQARLAQAQGPGSDAGPGPTGQEPPAQGSTSAELSCASCEGANDPDAKFCKHCGAVMASNTNTSDLASEPSGEQATEQSAGQSAGHGLEASGASQERAS